VRPHSSGGQGHTAECREAPGEAASVTAGGHPEDPFSTSARILDYTGEVRNGACVTNALCEYDGAELYER
jgi:hypothetical protein